MYHLHFRLCTPFLAGENHALQRRGRARPLCGQEHGILTVPWQIIKRNCPQKSIIFILVILLLRSPVVKNGKPESEYYSYGILYGIIDLCFISVTFLCFHYFYHPFVLQRTARVRSTRIGTEKQRGDSSPRCLNCVFLNSAQLNQSSQLSPGFICSQSSREKPQLSHHMQ